MQNKFQLAALSYAKRGWKVFPLHGITANGNCTCGEKNCSDAGKHPVAKNGLKAATSDIRQIKTFWSNNCHNIAILTGQASGITVLDIDIGKKGGDETWTTLNKKTGEPLTLMAQTGSGGAHVFFKYNSALKTSTNTLGPGIDCRNDGGYIVAPPSLHHSGNVYRWLNDEKLNDVPAHLTIKATRRRGRPIKNDPTRRKYTLEETSIMLQHISPDDRDMWRNVGIILGREFERSDEAWQIYRDWSATWGGKPGRNHDTIMREAFYVLGAEDGELSIGTLIHTALENGWLPKLGQVPLENFVYFAPSNNYIYKPTGAFWPAESVNSAGQYKNVNGIIAKPTVWLKEHCTVTSITTDPSITDVLRDGYDYCDGEFIKNEGARLYNAYRAPRAERGDPRAASPYFDHIYKLMPSEGDADQFLDYMAHRVQNPGEKIRFALLMGGEQGIGKDTAITMATYGIGIWNVANIEASALEGAFNEHSAAVLIVISEAANTHDMSKWAFNERMKTLIAGQPDYITINPKYGHKYCCRLHCGVIITTNHLTTGIYIPDDDRRYDVIKCATRREMGLESSAARAAYFDKFWHWYESENGAQHIYAALEDRDLKKFSPNAGQRKTAAHSEIVQIGMVHDQWIVDAIDLLKSDVLIRADSLWNAVQKVDVEMTRSKFNRSALHSLRRLGYARLTNTSIRDGRWLLAAIEGGKKRVHIYYHYEKITHFEALQQVQQLQEEF